MRMRRRRFLQTAAALLPIAAGCPLAFAAPPALALDVSGGIIPAPSDPAQWPAFRDALARWRDETRARLHYDDALYRRPEFAWSASNYACCFLMTWDETFYDRESGRYTVDAFLDSGARDFGGYDSVVLWHAYPRIGIDDRNQFDFYRDQPGGLRGLRAVTRRFHRRGVRVYIDYNPWDTGTRREGVSDADAIANVVRRIEADGVFLDTLNQGGAALRRELDAARPGVILEGEDELPLESLRDHHASWAQWFDDSRAPGVLKAKWIERRHMQHQVRRWDADHTGELQSAWMNGSGMMIWENVFGSWAPWSPRDRSMLRTMLPIQRRFTRLFQEGDWTPLVPVSQPDVFASLWTRGGVRLWTVVNRSEETRQGALLPADARPNHRWFDLVSGVELSPGSGNPALYGELPPRGIGCFLSGAEEDLGADFAAFLNGQAAACAQRSSDATRPRVKMKAVAPAPAPRAQVPPGMVEIPAAKMELGIVMRVRECGFYDSTLPADDNIGNSYDFRLHHFRRPIALPRFAIDETPVTNAQYAAFLRATRYAPRNKQNFLKHWRQGAPPAGRENHPVVHVDLDDARAYAAWALKRLPTEEEWQLAAQGTDGRNYPWGDAMEPGRCNGGETGGTTPVSAFPQGRSPFGCHDMCGNAWEWTASERSDGRTRFCIIRGGSFYTAKGSGWYADGGPRPANFAEKFILSSPGIDRCATIGFRCAADLAASMKTK